VRSASLRTAPLSRVFEGEGCQVSRYKTGADVFQVFKEHGVSIDLISTSETNITVSLDPAAYTLDEPCLEALPR
jgi:aspartokinase